MTFEVKSTEFFVKQISLLNSNSKKLIKNKIDLIKENPFHFKRIHSKRFNKVFRVRLNIQGKETRLIYVVLEPNIILVCLIDRNKDYRDLEKYLSKI